MDNMLKIEQGAIPGMLPEGRQAAEIGAGGEAKDLGSGDVEKMFGPAANPLEGLRAAGMVDESNP